MLNMPIRNLMPNFFNICRNVVHQKIFSVFHKRKRRKTFRSEFFCFFLILLNLCLVTNGTQRPHQSSRKTIAQLQEDEETSMESYYLSFQPDGAISNQTFASYLGNLHEMHEMTICYWLNFHYHHTTISLASYCAPAQNCAPTTKKIKCSNIQYHVENKIWDELRVEFSINAVKTKSLKAKIIPKTWNHHCFTYTWNTGKITMYSGGERQSQAELNTDKFAKGSIRGLHPAFPGKGILILGQEQEQICGGFDDYDSLSADVSEFQIWDHILTDRQIRDMGTCNTFSQGNVLSWIKSKDLWKISNVTSVDDGNLRQKFCSSVQEERQLIVFPERRSIEMAEYVCKVHGGVLPVPHNYHENREMADLGKSFKPVCSEDGKENLNQPYMWLGIEDPEGSGIWRNKNDGTNISFSNWDEDEGSEGDTCARILADGIWRDTVCKKSVRHCIACLMKEKKQVFTLRGLCEESQIDRGYFLTNGKVEDLHKTRMKPVYEGYFSLLSWVPNTKSDETLNQGSLSMSGHWQIASRLEQKKDGYLAITNATSRMGYPIGRHLWLVTDPKCDLFEPTWKNLTLSRCGEDQFTCADGFCIPAEQRCDLVQNCKDFSDELDCDTVIVPSTYLLNPPTVPGNHKSHPVNVSLRVNILNIDKIDTVNMMFALTMEVNLEWRDHRLKYKNLREGLGQNQLTENEIENVWKPTVTFTNAKIGQLEIKELGLMVRRESEPEGFSYISSVEDKVYSGKENSLVLSRKYYAEYGCTFDLRSFPFDDQKCAMNFTMDSAKADYIVLMSEKITYQGEILLLEFFLKDISPQEEPKVSESGKSMVVITIKFHRELGNMVNTYFQTFLLCLMAYLTLYINLADFGNRFMGALTSLLVLASLLASIEENLPKTSYFKKIDIWFMSYIIFIFIIIVFHICVDFCTSHRDEILQNSDTHIMARKLKVGATYLNNVGKVIFPIILIVFTVLYFVLSLI